jgi:hypothetical protein
MVILGSSHALCSIISLHSKTFRAELRKEDVGKPCGCQLGFAFQLILTSACRFSHFGSQNVEATWRTTRDDPRLAYEDK